MMNNAWYRIKPTITWQPETTEYSEKKTLSISFQHPVVHDTKDGAGWMSSGPLAWDFDQRAPLEQQSAARNKERVSTENDLEIAKLKQVDMSEVEKHRDSSSCWIVVDRIVYDVTSFLGSHPGGMYKLSQLLVDAVSTNRLVCLFVGRSQ
jgi:cytochrome b involved in lipid metabolism